jgi:predicted ester cyclase
MPDQKAFVNSAFDCINKGDLNKFKEHLDPKLHNVYADAFQKARTAFPDMKLKIEDIIQEGDTVVVHWTFNGTHKGEAAGYPFGPVGLGPVKPTGKPVHVSGFTKMKIANGKVVSSAGENSGMQALQQVGLLSHFAAAVERVHPH